MILLAGPRAADGTCHSGTMSCAANFSGRQHVRLDESVACLNESVKMVAYRPPLQWVVASSQFTMEEDDDNLRPAK